MILDGIKHERPLLYLSSSNWFNYIQNKIEICNNLISTEITGREIKGIIRLFTTSVSIIRLLLVHRGRRPSHQATQLQRVVVIQIPNAHEEYRQTEENFHPMLPVLPTGNIKY